LNPFTQEAETPALSGDNGKVEKNSLNFLSKTLVFPTPEEKVAFT
jgi:hypothetical protein